MRIGQKNNIDYYCGKRYNVGKRILNAISSHCQGEPDVVVRVLLKRFYLDLELVSLMINHIIKGYDYVELDKDINYELSTDVMSYKALKSAIEMIYMEKGSFSNASYKFLSWQFFSDNPKHFKIYHLESNTVSNWDDQKTQKIKNQLGILFSENENKNLIACDDPGSRYQKVKNYINSNNSVLDIACGQGQGSMLLSNYAKSVLGIDLNSRYISSAQNNISDKYSNLKYFRGTSKELCNINQKFQKIVSLHILEHIEKDLEFLLDLNNLLAEDGLLILKVPRLMPVPLRQPLLPFHIREYSEENLNTLLNETGFQIIEKKAEPEDNMLT